MRVAYVDVVVVVVVVVLRTTTMCAPKFKGNGREQTAPRKEGRTQASRRGWNRSVHQQERMIGGIVERGREKEEIRPTECTVIANEMARRQTARERLTD